MLYPLSVSCYCHELKPRRTVAINSHKITAKQYGMVGHDPYRLLREVMHACLLIKLLLTMTVRSVDGQT